MEELAEQLARIGFDLHFPLIKVELNECKTLSLLRDYLCAIKRFEAMGYLFNISITFCENKNFYYKDIFYECCQMDLMSIVKVHQTEYVSVLLMNAINMYNINCENFDVYLGDLQTKISVEYKNKKYYFGREEYVGFKFKKKCVISENILIEDERIYNSEENVFIRKFQINNSYDKPIEVGFVYPVEIKDENGANCCVQFDKMKNRFFLKIDNDKSVENFATINFFDSYKMNKKIINFYKKIKVLPHQEFVFYVVGGDYLCGKIFTENDCEKLIVQSVQEYLKLPYIRLKSENKALNRLINFNLPQKIIKKHIFSSGKNVQDFLILKQENEGKILKKEEFCCNLNYLFFEQENLGKLFSSLLFNLVGVAFNKNGILINKNKKQIINSVLEFDCFGKRKQIEIVKGLGFGVCRFDSIEYSNISFLPYTIFKDRKNMVLKL